VLNIAHGEKIKKIFLLKSYERNTTGSVDEFFFSIYILPPWIAALMGADELAEKNSLNRIVARESIRLQRIAQRAKVSDLVNLDE
jgi:hypothetical protein